MALASPVIVRHSSIVHGDIVVMVGALVAIVDNNITQITSTVKLIEITFNIVGMILILSSCNNFSGIS